MRLNVYSVDPTSTQAVLVLQGYVRGSGLDHRPWELATRQPLPD